MRIVIHDYSGHPFQIQLSRRLARRGHHVLHLYFSAFETPRGALVGRDDDPPTLQIEGLEISRPFQKYRFVRRLLQEREYGRVLADRIRVARPDVVISANAPLDVQAAALTATREVGGRFVFWLQDVYSVAIERLLRPKVPLGSQLIAWRFRRLETSILRNSDAVVAITRDFLPILSAWGVGEDRVTVIENWAPLDDLPPRPRDNEWAAEHDLAGRKVVLYTGTLGLKHNPALLLRLAESLADDPEARVVVVSEGIGADWLLQHGDGLRNLVILPFQPFGRLPDVMASSALLVAILEPTAGIFSVPSKVMTYLAAGRPILGAIPSSNLAARRIEDAGAGRVVDPRDVEGFVRAARALIQDPDGLAAAGRRARDYAEAHFDIDQIADQFEAVIRATDPAHQNIGSGSRNGAAELRSQGGR